MKIRLGDLLVNESIITEGQLDEVLREKSNNQKLGDALLDRGYITERKLIEVLEFQLGIPHVRLPTIPIDSTLTTLVHKDLARKNVYLPIQKQNDKLVVAMADPLDFHSIEDLRLSTGFQIKPVIASKTDIIQAINKYYSNDSIKDSSIDEANESDQISASAIRVVEQLLTNAIESFASDIHLDPHENQLVVRYRIDGLLHNEQSFAKSMQSAIISRIKVMAELDITEFRVPQDGRTKIKLNDTKIDLRISTIPTMYGEKVVIRILDLSKTHLRMSNLSLTEKNEENFLQLLDKPNGLVLLTGPTGSGKTSTLYTGLNHLNSETVNIITIEDPVEYQLEGINQIQVNDSVGLTFSTGLRSILRQDPNIIMVGEIRDAQTAEIAIQASLTGHLVLSTLHTNDAISSITRLIDMGIEPYLISSSVSGVVGQRLVRKTCDDCKVSYEPTDQEKQLFATYNMKIDKLYRGAGCTSCRSTGFLRRIPIHEVLIIDDTIRDLIINKASNASIRNHYQSIGTQWLIEDGLEKAKKGLTTVEEVMRVSTID
ncbi:GspE/PulE family protein [Alkalihalobacillus sp. AL-G]|uniref:GspE/PulE family protein n=1 Tax=Alkalihalobacillus sp. AL-G TaxID=2926399 RepID=UPI00272BF1B9|nr:ATPase, T2SS/T4P/T4SS family [Alkalihalobacillus sp. AL-G]WLD92251.1 Flp pilus assembly complex ATPase component TadA [Alkalihalobacillus sp. AL-G]